MAALPGYRLGLASTAPRPSPFPGDTLDGTMAAPCPTDNGVHTSPTSRTRTWMPPQNGCLPTWMPPNRGCSSSWMPTPHLDYPSSWRTPVCPPSLPPSHIPIHLDTSHTWMPPNPGCRLFLDAPHIWMPPHLRAPPTWMPSSHLDASPSWITSECPAHLDVPQSRFPSPAFPIPIPQSRFPSPGCLSPHRVLPRPTHYPIMPRFPQGTQGTVVHSLPAFRWSRPRTLWARRGGALLIDLWLGLWKRRICGGGGAISD